MSYHDSYLLRHITRRGVKNIHAREERDDVKATSLVNNPRRTESEYLPWKIGVG